MEEQHPQHHIGPTADRVLAIFDLDKTIIDTSASLAYGRPMAERGLISTSDVLRMLVVRSSYMFTTHTEEDMNATKETMTAIIKGREVEPLRAVVRDTLQESITPYVYAEARELLEWHKQQGHTVAIVTASPSVMVQPIAEELGADLLIASELGEEDGKFTGEMTLFNKGITKVHHIEDIAAKHGFNLAESFAYSDSGTDVPMLEMVGFPTAVNPDRALRKVAVERGWPIKNFKRPEPLFQTGALAGAGATLAVIGAVATGIAWWLLRRGEDTGEDGRKDAA